jgi:hypothetical protein
MDASNFDIGCILSEKHESDLYHITYHSWKMKLAERYYDIYDKQLLAVVEAFKYWQPYYHGT